jgi:hypothetical protein
MLFITYSVCNTAVASTWISYFSRDRLMVLLFPLLKRFSLLPVFAVGCCGICPMSNVRCPMSDTRCRKARHLSLAENGWRAQHAYGTGLLVCPVVGMLIFSYLLSKRRLVKLLSSHECRRDDRLTRVVISLLARHGHREHPKIPSSV